MPDEPEITSLPEALRAIEDWEAAYLRLLLRYVQVRRQLEHARAAIENDLAAIEAAERMF